jgi:hypothetical protein
MRSLILVATILGSLASATSAQAEVLSDSFTYKGKSADAYFYAYGDCTYLSGNVYGGEQVTHQAGTGAPVSGKYVSAYLYGYNYCTGESFSGYGYGDAVSVAQNLGSATLSVPVSLWSWGCYDDGAGNWTCSSNDLGSGLLSVTLTANDATTYKGHSHGTYNAGPYRSSYRSNGTYRTADAAASLVLGGVDLLAGVLGSGTIASSQSGSRTLYKN